MSVRRPGRRYVGFRFDPPSAARRDVSRAIEAAWNAIASGEPLARDGRPRLLVCEQGAGILVVPSAASATMRAALAKPSGSNAGIVLRPVVTSGTIATVKERLGLPLRRPR